MIDPIYGSAPVAELAPERPSTQTEEPSPIQRREGARTEAAQPLLEAQALMSNDTMTLLYAMQIAQRDGQLAEGKSAVENQHQKVEAAREAARQALEKALEEAEKKAHSGGLLGTLQTVAKVAAVVAAAAAVIACPGSALAIIALAGVLMSTFSKDIAKACGGGETMEKILMYTGVALSLAAGVGAFTGILGTTTSTAGTLANGARFVGKGATIVGAGATIASGKVMYDQGQHEANEVRARADESEGKAKQKAAMREMEMMIEMLKDVEASFTRAKESISQALEYYGASQMAAVNVGVRA
jgi:vacuolar-type H+-ATPase subunit E/Vma4